MTKALSRHLVEIATYFVPRQPGEVNVPHENSLADAAVAGLAKSAMSTLSRLTEKGREF